MFEAQPDQMIPQPENRADGLELVTLLHLISSRHDSLKPGYSTPRQQWLLDPEHVPTSLTPPQMETISGQVADLVRSTQPRVDPESFEARKQGRRAAIESVSWLGELLLIHRDMTSAHSAVGQLRDMGGIAGRRASRKLQKHVDFIERFGGDYPVYSVTR